MKRKTSANTPLQRYLRGVLLVCTAGSITSCGFLGKYDPQEARCLNFQRIVAKDERRIQLLDVEVKNARRELAEMDERHRELVARVNIARAEMARLQEENETIKEAAALRTTPDLLVTGLQESAVGE